MHFFYQKLFSGAWQPVKQPDAPRQRGAEGTAKPKTCGHVELPPEHHHLTLAELTQLYPINPAMLGGAHVHANA